MYSVAISHLARWRTDAAKIGRPYAFGNFQKCLTLSCSSERQSVCI